MKRIILFLTCLLFIISPCCNLAAQEAEWEEIGGDIFDVRCILAIGEKSQHILVGNNGNIFCSFDLGKSWTRSFSLRGNNKNINQIVPACPGKQTVYAATDQGVYASINAGIKWKKVFSGLSKEENMCTSLAVKGKTIILGTNKGLYISKDAGRSWGKETGVLGRSRILNIEVYSAGKKTYYYAATINGVFRKQDDGAWEKIYSQSDKADAVNDEQGNITDSQGYYFGIRYIKCDQSREGVLYLSTGKGIYKSVDGGDHWESIAEYGLLERDVKYLCLAAPGRLFAVTDSGIFMFNNSRWLEQTGSLSTGIINTLAISEQGTLFIGASKGIFKSVVPGGVVSYGNKIGDYSANEPKINLVQQAAIAYAEVSPEKIKKWRKQAAKKAFFPVVSVGLERDSSDLWHWESGSTAIGQSGDDLLRKGKDNIDWDVRLSWNLGEIIWNDDQAAIDVRSKLMVELRDDILDQVNKLYFERLRVKMELAGLSLEDVRKRNEKELKLQELTASLDALTGGYFSRSSKA
jgi:photosystem II stability/assembly factor-like uncharacterized protein